MCRCRSHWRSPARTTRRERRPALVPAAFARAVRLLRIRHASEAAHVARSRPRNPLGSARW
jgi:hypothetical protein